MKPIKVGTEFVILKVEVTWLNGLETVFLDFNSLAHQLFMTYFNPLPDELPNEPWIRVGYRRMVWCLEPVDAEPFALTYELGEKYWWTGIGGPEVVGDVNYHWSFSKHQHRTMELKGALGSELGRHISLLRCQPVVLRTYLSGFNAGVNSHDNYVAMTLRNSDEFLAEGTISITRSTSRGDFQRELWDMEGSYGRADQPGNYEYYAATHGGINDR